jgi:V/A-type H+-transporting ATPase subunit E
LDQVKNEGDKRVTIMRNIHLSEARRVARRITLGAKEELIDECFSKAKEQLRSLTGEEYKNVLVQLIKDSLPLIGESGTVKLTREEDKSILSSFPNLTQKPGLVQGLGGIILESSDGKIVVDNTFDAILERKKEDIRTEVAKILFPES